MTIFKVNDVVKRKDAGRLYKVREVYFGSRLYKLHSYTTGAETFQSFDEVDNKAELYSSGANFYGELAWTGYHGYPATPKGCDHTMKYYEGIREAYNYCTKCDHKEKV